ncbi:MAG: glucan biosynthesis protein G, partial [Comamonadaceae bacterium]
MTTTASSRCNSSALRRLLPQLALAAASTLMAAQALAFSLDDVTARARALADQPYAAPQSNLPPEFSSLQFADYMKIQPRADRLMWADQQAPFRLSFYHQGMQFNAPVRIHEIVGDQVQEMRYESERFDFGDLNFNREATSQLGYAGFRVLSPINQPGKWDEVMSLLGASYFRVIGQGQWYGLSARGLAIDTVPAGAEEFPNFREFWIRRPDPQDKTLLIYALLDSPRATGAYQFILQPGSDTVVDVQSNIFFRADVTRIGIAPLTSMFLY